MFDRLPVGTIPFCVIPASAGIRYARHKKIFKANFTAKTQSTQREEEK